MSRAEGKPGLPAPRVSGQRIEAIAIASLFLLSSVAVLATSGLVGSVVAQGSSPSYRAPQSAADSPATQALPNASTPVPSNSPHPGTLEIYEVLDHGAPTLDPAVAYDAGSQEPIQNVYQTLVNYNGTSTASFVPTLATCVPGTVQCVTDYGSNLTGFVAGQPIYWTFVIDPAAHFYDPTTHASWGVYPTDVVFSFARTLAYADLPFEAKDPGWMQAQALLPSGSAWDRGLHFPLNNTPARILGSMLINNTTYCPAAAIANAHGCVTFVANGGGSDWPYFLELVADNLGASVVPCGWFAAESAGMPGWSSPAAHGDGPCAIPQLGTSQSTDSAAWASYLANLSSNSPTQPQNVTSWDAFEEQANNQPSVNPKVQFSMVGSGPYYAGVVPGTAYQLSANPAYQQPSGCSGVGGLATYTGYCDPAVGGYIANVHVYWEADDSVGIDQYRAHDADVAAIEATHIPKLLQLAALGDLYYFIFPTLSSLFTPVNLYWSQSSYSAEFPSDPLPNMPANFLTNLALRQFYVHAYPYMSIEDGVRTVDGIQLIFNAGGPIPYAMGNYYPTNVSYPSVGGDPDTNPSDIGGAAWWWAQLTNPASVYYDPQLASCTSHSPCTWAIEGMLLGDPDDDSAITDWITSIESLTGSALQPFMVTPSLDGCLGPCPDTPYHNPVSSSFPTGWAPDYPDPVDYMTPLAYPNSTYTAPDAFSQQLGYGLPAVANNTTCGHSATNFADLVYWAHQAQSPANGTLNSTCQGVSYSVATYWNQHAADLPVGPGRILDYNLVTQILNGLAMYVWNGQSNMLFSAAPWIEQASIDQNPMIGGGGDQYWFMIRTLPFQSTVEFKSAGLPAGTLWGVDAGALAKTNLTVHGSGTILFSSPNGTFRYNIVAPSGYGVAHIAGPGGPSFTSVNVTGHAITLTVTFGAINTVTFNQTIATGWPGLPASTVWGVTLTSHGGPGKPPVSIVTKTNSTNFLGATDHSVVFQAIKGVTYSWQVSTPAGYQASGGHGTFTMGAHPLVKPVKYKLYSATISFTESHLPAHTSWTVYVNETTTPFIDTVLTGIGTLKGHLTNGTYSYFVPKVGTQTPTPASGSITVLAPHAQTVRITFSAALHAFGPTPSRLVSSLSGHTSLIATTSGREAA